MIENERTPSWVPLPLPSRDPSLCCFFGKLIGTRSHSRVYSLRPRISFWSASRNTGAWPPVHLSVMEQEGGGEQAFEQMLSIPAPDEKGVVIEPGADVHGSIQFRLSQGGGADDHIRPSQIVRRTGILELPGQRQIIPFELFQLLVEGNAAGIDAAVLRGNDSIDREAVEPHQLFTHRQQIEFLELRVGPANVPAHEHAEFAAMLSVLPDQIGDVQGLEQCNHGYENVHPKFKGLRPAVFPGSTSLIIGSLLAGLNLWRCAGQYATVGREAQDMI